MARQPEQDDEDWDLPSNEVLKELSPLQEIRRSSLFQRIVRQRAVYFADVEDGQNDGEDEDGSDGTNNSPDNKDDGQGEDRLLSSGFADLSTWCCDAFPPARSNPASPEKWPPRLVSIADQPTVVLSLLDPSQIYIADMPTQPDLSARGAFSTSSGFSSRSVISFVGGKLWGALSHFCRRLLRAWPGRTRRTRRVRKKRSSGSMGHELLMERLRERQERGVSALLPIPPGERHPRQVRLPADRLFS